MDTEHPEPINPHDREDMDTEHPDQLPQFSRTREEGRNPGTLTGISRRADVAIPRFSLDTLAQKESTPDAMARRGKLVRAAI